MPDRERLRELAARLAAGRTIDWEGEERAAGSDEERAAIRELRVVAAIAMLGELAQAAPESDDLVSSVASARSLLAEDGAEVAGPADEPPATPGTRWGHVEILERIGRGAFGEVYRARDTRLDRVVALKWIAGSAPGTGEEVVREARLLARVRHPNVVTVHGADRIDGRVGIWMEYVEGETLDRVLRQRGTLDAREAALIGIDLCRALSAVHAAGVAHRDVKLANVMRARGGRIVLMDFGLGHEWDATGGARLRRLSGTPLFMAPEVLRGEPGDPQADIYSLGVVLFALVTGRLPIEASSLPELLARHERREVGRVRDLRPDVSEAFVQVLDRMLDPSPVTRFRSAGEAEEALLRTLGAAAAARSPESAQGTRRRNLFLVGLAVALVAFGAGSSAWLASRNAPAAARPAPFGATPDLTIVGEFGGMLFGLSVEGVGDVDQDGYDDVCIAAPVPGRAGPAGGKVYLYRGSPTGLERRASWEFSLPDSGRYLGQAIGQATDVNQDGFADVVIGASGTGDGRPGEVLVFTGSRSGLPAKPTQVIRGAAAEGLFGFAVSTGDVNHDGRPDLLVGDPWHPPARSGRAFLHLSRGSSFEVEPSWTFAGPESSQFGLAVALGDVNHDGYDDAVIGAPTGGSGPATNSAGAAFVFLGSERGLARTPTAVAGRQPGAMLGRDVVLADLDGDGSDDMLVGAEEGSNGEQGEGIAEVHFGSHAGVSPYASALLESNVMGANFGGHAAPLGDVDGDGCADLFVGALRYQQKEPRAGAAFIYCGSRNRVLRRPWFRVGPQGGSWYGADGGAAGDVNGDGRPDFVVSAPSWDTAAGQNTGMVEVFLGARRR